MRETIKHTLLAIDDALAVVDPGAAARQAGDVAQYFRSLGFTVTWDFRQSDNRHWYEIYAGDELLIQIDFGASLADLMTDLLGDGPVLPLPAGGQPSRHTSTWEVRSEGDGLQRVVAAMRRGVP